MRCNPINTTRAGCSRVLSSARTISSAVTSSAPKQIGKAKTYMRITNTTSPSRPPPTIRRILQCYHDHEGLSLGPRPAGLCVGPFPAVRHRRLGLGQSSTAYGRRRRRCPVVHQRRQTFAQRLDGGRGLEYAFTDHVLGRLEYRYTDLRTSGFVNTATDTADAGGHLPINDFRAGIAYKFDGDLIFARMLGDAGK